MEGDKGRLWSKIDKGGRMEEVFASLIEKEKIKDFIEANWGKITFLLDKIIDYRLIELDIIWLIWDMVYEVKDEIDKKGDAFWEFRNGEAYALGYMKKDKISAKVIVNTEYKKLLVAVEIDWFEFKCSVEIEVNNDEPKFKFLVIEKAQNL